MWHNLDTYRHDNGQMTQTNKLVFPTREIADIGLVDHDGIIVEATVSFKGINEDREPSYVTFKRSTSEHASKMVDMLHAMSIALVNTPSYFTDNDGSMFPYDKIMYVNFKTRTMHLTNGVAIALTKNEFERFYDEYRNWLDLSK